MDKCRLANHQKRQSAIIEGSRGSLRNEGNVELWRALRVANSGETARERHNYGLYTANARCKEM